ncbi:unnamed protein product [Caenorhabditis auriculariae]|uniref:Cleavage/polyadenylation specificity factor A subunit C-terminal domain-containing protein n=1 Tax=Caenorhabditis auriculariae TaxID=2777116 RepID=A0A8S1HBX6_9PELO|nr:unnamed protein product [Caenorhabditis auriculariae]
MYAYFRETDDSTTVNFSAYGKFLKGAGNQLVTIGAKYVRLFRTNPYMLVEPDADEDQWRQKTKLECMFSSRLLSKVQSFAVARVPQCADQDVMLMAFDHAKLSIVSVSSKERNLQTISLHAFESEYLREGFTHFFPDPIVRVDPSNRCAAMLVYGRHIAILPFHENAKRISSYIIPLKQIDARLENVIDMVFLDGYYEPTLLFLYEPLQTTAGRASIRFDTMCMMGVSVNINDRQFAVVWQTANLPMDCQTLLAVPKPLGGAVLFGSNEFIYLNQAVPPCGISLNSCYDNFTKFPLKDMKDMAMTLDCACMTWMEDGRIAIGTRDGQLLLLRLISTGGTTVKSLELTKVFDCSIPYTLCVCAPGHLFVGSRLGDSQLLEYTLVKKAKDELDAKKPKLDRNEDEIAIDEDDFELYGSTIEDQQNDEDEAIVETLAFKELDRLKNIGPVKSMCFGQSHDLSPVLNQKSRLDPIFDIITASGHGKDGSLCLLQRSVRPEIITSSYLENAQQMWAVGRKEDESHKYLIVTRLRSTLVLELGEEMVELEEPLFVSGEPTVAAGELLQGSLAVQVTSMCIALVADGQQLQEVHIDSNFPVTMASIVDPYVAVLTQNGQLLLYQLVTAPYVHLKEVDLSSTPFSSARNTTLTSISIYSDATGLMMCSTSKSVAEAEEEPENKEADTTLYGDDDDFLLYGEPTTSSKTSTNQKDTSRKRKRLGHNVVYSSRGGEQSDAIDPTKSFANVTFWLVLVHENGRLVIHSLPDMTVVYQIRKFFSVPEVLNDTSVEEEERDRRAKAALAATAHAEQMTAEISRPEERVTEAQIVGMGINQGHAILMAIVDEQVVMYEMFVVDNPIPEHLCVSFRRLHSTVFLRSSPYIGTDGRRATLEIGNSSERPYSIIHPFERLSSVNNGVMIIGPVPTLVLYSSWGGIQTHEFTLDGTIKAFTPFNNENVLHGFVYLTEADSELRIARLSPDFDYDMPYPSRKVPVGATVHHVRYLMNSEVYAVVTSVAKPSNKIWVVMNDDKQEETHEKDDKFVLPSIADYKLNLYSPQDWAAVPNTEIVFEKMEVVTACEDVALKSESTMSGMETFLALGTVNNYGEEVLVRGRIILCEIIDVVPEPGQPTSNRKIKTLYDKEQKGPVTSLCAVNGLLLSGMGQKVFIWMYKDGDLHGLSFLDMHYYVHQMISVRSIVLACDVEDSMSLVRFQEEFKALSVASRDDRKCAQPPMTAQYVVDGSRLGFVMSDEAANVFMFNYAPEQTESNGGDRLVVRAAINIGTNINAFLRCKGRTSLSPATTVEEQQALMQQQTTIFSSLDGSFGYIRPISEKSFRRLHFLQTFVPTVTEQGAGLHPKGARVAKPQQPIVNGASHRNIVDGDVIEQYLHLSNSDKQDLARRLGASRYHIIDDIVQMRRMASYF